MHDGYSIIGTSTRGLELAAPVTLTHDDRRHHLHLIGGSGCGKTNTQKTLVYADLASTQHQDFLLLDPLGSLADAAVDAVPEHKNDRVIYFAPGEDLEHCVGLNPLHNVVRDKHHLVADGVVSAFAHVWGTNLDVAPRLSYLLYFATRLLLADPQGSTLLGISRVFRDDHYRNYLLRHTSDPMVESMWLHEYPTDPREQSEIVRSVNNKVSMLLAPPALRNVLGQRRSTIDIARLMNEGGSMICNLSKGTLGEVGSSLLGSLIVSTVAQVAQERTRIPFSERRPFTLFVDELQNFSTLSFASILSELRNMALMWVGGHQYLGQLHEKVRDAILANCSTSIVFRVSDGDMLAHKLGLPNPGVLAETANYKAWVKLLRDGLPTDPFLVDMVEAVPPAVGRKAAVVAHTRARHTRPRDVVERSIRQQLGQ